MRRIATGVLALTLTLTALLGAPAPAAASTEAPSPKVVLVVGATHGTTSTYRTWMNEVYTAARKYTDNVVKVYSPNATWDAIKNASQGASVLVYMGHGNGFPSPYRDSPYPQSQNGFGANATAGNGDSNTKYYGEAYIGRDITLAPNAVVILSHLCYASGNSEPGKADPSLSQAKQRLDNYAAGFIAAGARAVIADGHMDPAFYIHQMFTTRRTIDTIFRSHPSARGQVHTFASVRSPGFTASYDPDQDDPVSGFYRSMVAVPGLVAEDVIGAGGAPSDEPPADFSIPGAAEVVTDGAGLFADSELTPDETTGQPLASMVGGTRLRIAGEAATATGVRVLQVRPLGTEVEGWMRADDLAPRDSAGPKITRFAATPTVLSPIISGSRTVVAAAASEKVTWKLTITDADDRVVMTKTKVGTEILTSWNGRQDGSVVADGVYRLSLVAQDGWGNEPARTSAKARVDATRPVLGTVRAAGAGPVTFSPNDDGTDDAVTIPYEVSENADVKVVVRDDAGESVMAKTLGVKAGQTAFTWDGRDKAGDVVADGEYTIELTPVDAAGNRGDVASETTLVYTALRAVAMKRPVFYPADGDALGESIALPFALDRAARVTWTIVDQAGATVLTIKDGEALPKGAYSYAWNGTDGSGAALPAGVYRSVVSATNGTAKTCVTGSVSIAPFVVTVSDQTPARRQKVTFTITSAEPLAANPTVKVVEPGRRSVVWQTRKVGTHLYRVTVTLVGKKTGSLVVRVSGTDTAGGMNTLRVSYPLH